MKTFYLCLLITCFYFNPINSQTSHPVSNFRIEVKNIDKLGKYKNMVNDAISLLNEVFNSEDFKNRVLTKEFDWNQLTGGHAKISNEAVLHELMGWTDVAEVKLKIKPRLYTHEKVLGITKLKATKTKTYRHWLNLSPANYLDTVISYASHIAHEYCHQRNFSDKKSSDPCKFRDVIPYAIGDIVCQILNSKNNTDYDCDEC